MRAKFSICLGYFIAMIGLVTMWIALLNQPLDHQLWLLGVIALGVGELLCRR